MRFALNRPTRSPGGAGRVVPDGLPAGHDLGGRRVLWIADRSEVLPALGQAASYQNAAWMMAYLVMAVSMVVGMVTVLFSNEPAQCNCPGQNLAVWLKGAVVEPFADFLRRYGWHAALILALIAVYRISDVVMGIMANPFYVDMGYTKAEVATVTKIYGVVMTLLGAFVGGVLSMRFGVMRILMLGALLSAGSNLLFAWLAGHGHDVTALIAVVSADNLAGGGVGRVHCLPLQPDKRELFGHAVRAVQLHDAAAAQVCGRFSGDYVNAFGYAQFFTSTALLGVPVLLLVWLASKVKNSL